MACLIYYIRFPGLKKVTQFVQTRIQYLPEFPFQGSSFSFPSSIQTQFQYKEKEKEKQNQNRPRIPSSTLHIRYIYIHSQGVVIKKKNLH